MGYLNNGQWIDQWYDTTATKGAFKREKSQFRHTIKQSNDIFKPEKDRYHLYVSYACPWAHRTLIFRQLKQLESIISVSVVEPIMLEHGWVFSKTYPDHLYNNTYLYQLYKTSNPTYVGRVTVPILWDKQTKQIVNNESEDIIRLFNTAFNHITNNTTDYYPKHLQQKIDKINQLVYHKINNGVYKAGFATTQDSYNQAVTELFNALDQLEIQLQEQPYLTGNQITEADWRLFTTLIRFDAVYVGHFKCNLKRLIDYPNLHTYCKKLLNHNAIQSTTFMDHIKTHYYKSHPTINPTGVVPLGPTTI